tara:strand:- start:8544 stop:8765 length:222 start_codon:yes stop_codon:yes gene_type:complete
MQIKEQEALSQAIELTKVDGKLRTVKLSRDIVLTVQMVHPTKLPASEPDYVQRTRPSIDPKKGSRFMKAGDLE